MFASLVSVRGRVLFVLALGLAPWKCWLAAMTQRYSIREGKNEKESKRETRRFGLSLMPQCATGLDSLSWPPMTDSARLALRFAVRVPVCLAYHVTSARLDGLGGKQRDK